ncbi:MAG: GDP-mannose 4,6-dehydratase [Planctomycetota bacterium]
MPTAPTPPNTLVLGSNSFSGQDFIDLLLTDTDHRVIGVSRSPEKSPVFLSYLQRPQTSQRFAFHQLDLNDDFDDLAQLIQREKPDYIVNFAAQSEVAPSWLHPEQWAMTNVVAIAKLGNFLRQCDWLKKYVHISSPEAYGTCEGTVAEGHPDNPSTPYAASKSAGDQFLATYVKQYDFPCVTIRATNVYGPHQQLFKIIPRSAIYLKLGKTIELHGGGHAVKSYIHIRDVSQGELAAMLNGDTGKMYHLSPTEGVAVRDVVKTICDAAGQDFDTATKIVDERPGQDKAYVIDSTKARTQFGWSPVITLEHGLSEVFEWVDREWHDIQKRPLTYEHKA